MLFNSFQYLIFLPIFLVLYWMVPQKYRNVLLLIGSYIFYAAWNPIYLVLIVAMTLANYAFGFLISFNKKFSKAFLIFAIVCDLLVLIHYKYANFLVESLFRSMEIVHMQHGYLKFDVILPLGISFFTFEFLHYIIDVYRGGAVVKDPIKFAVFAGYFPTQIAGPIKRYQDFIPQISRTPKFDINQFESGFVLVLHGLAKKVLLADNLATYVDIIYANPNGATTLDLWLAAYAFGYQVYCDFSGYTDIAIGSSMMMGITIPKNFDVPYMSSSIRELWRRHNITVSFWFRDYVYFALGGARCSKLRACFNVILTTSLAGLWHGAAWHFVVWGIFQGVLLIGHRVWMSFYEKRENLNQFVHTKLWFFIAIFITYHVSCFPVVFFRAPTNTVAFNIVGRMLQLWTLPPHSTPIFMSSLGPLVCPLIPYMVAGLAISHIVSEFLRSKGFWARSPRLLQAAYCVFLIFMLLALMPDESNKFIYFQF